MTDDESDEWPQDPLSRQIRDLHDAATVEYEDDPLGSTIEHLKDEYGPYLEWFDSGDWSAGFLAGYRQAIHDAQHDYISFSGNYNCDCTHGQMTPLKEEPGRWRCGRCGEVLAEPDDDVVGIQHEVER